MLASLTIKNIVLIDKLTINFSENLCALTGETGAGKSILLDSLGLALGNRSDAGLVKQGTDQASVIADFDLDLGHSVFHYLKQNDLEAESGELVLRRVLTKEGRSKAYVNDQPVSVSLLKELGEYLIEIHGQFDTQNLLDPSNHINMLDEYGGFDKELLLVRTTWDAWQAIQTQLNEMRENMDKAREDEEYFKKSLEDLDALSPEDSEEEKLVSLRSRLMRREQILENLSEAEASIGEIEGLSNSVWRALDKLGEDGDVAIKAMNAANAEIQEVISALHQISSDIENSEYSLSEIDDRLFALKAQARKHGCQIDELSKKREEIAQLLNAIENQDGDLSELIKKVEITKKEYLKQAQDLSNKRKKMSEKMAKLIMKELVPLKLDKARFEVVVEPMAENKFNKTGIDKVQFLIATNPGSVAGPLNKIASGGELSRFTLALKVILAETGVAHSLVFDEVDSGIGGATAAAVGERLAKLAQHKQILVVTHSPQVAAMAQNHWIVSKTSGKQTLTNIVKLQKDNDRTEEIARMLSGSEITNEARAAAVKLLEVSFENKAA